MHERSSVGHDPRSMIRWVNVHPLSSAIRGDPIRSFIPRSGIHLLTAWAVITYLSSECALKTYQRGGGLERHALSKPAQEGWADGPSDPAIRRTGKMHMYV